MPKVSQEYIANKKKMITDCAYALCLEKTVSTVTMQDIINRTGLSQGGIYRFYKDIDEIFADMLVEMRKQCNIKEKVDEVLAQVEGMPNFKVAYCVSEVLADFMSEELMGFQKVDFELSVLSTNDPVRVQKILEKTTGIGNKEYILMRTAEFYRKKIESGELKARVSEKELVAYITAMYSGIQESCIITNCYHSNPDNAYFQPKSMFHTFAKTLNFLLGVE